MININEIHQFPHIEVGDNLPRILTESIRENHLELNEGDIFCVASKVVSISENRIVCLDDVTAGQLALKIHKSIPRKDPRLLQLIINATGDESGNRIEVSNNYIAGWLPNGLRLTSSGIDKIDGNHAVLLPLDPDRSAKKIGEEIYNAFGVRVGVVITDSDGRIEKKGATQIAIGVYGVPPLRKTIAPIDNIGDFNNMSTAQTKESVETLCDFLAAAAALIMGQRGTNKPVVVISGVNYHFDPNASIIEALTKAPIS